MAKTQETFSKQETEKKKLEKKKEKEKRREERKANSKEVSSFEDMIAYVDENGNISSTPPDPRKIQKIREEDIEIGVPKQEAVQAKAKRKGTVTFFNEAKGYGFIKDSNNQESIFVHVNGLVDKVKEHSKVTFDVEMGLKGPNAVNVRLDH